MDAGYGVPILLSLPRRVLESTRHSGCCNTGSASDNFLKGSLSPSCVVALLFEKKGEIGHHRLYIAIHPTTTTTTTAHIATPHLQQTTKQLFAAPRTDYKIEVCLTSRLERVLALTMEVVRIQHVTTIRTATAATAAGHSGERRRDACRHEACRLRRGGPSERNHKLSMFIITPFYKSSPVGRELCAKVNVGFWCSRIPGSQCLIRASDHSTTSTANMASLGGGRVFVRP